MQEKTELRIEYVSITELQVCEYNARVWSHSDRQQLKASLSKFGILDPLIVNSTPERLNVVVGGNFRLFMLKELGHESVPIVRVHLDLEKEKELNLRLNKNQGSFDLALLAEFDESFLADIGFDSVELDEIFDEEAAEGEFDLEQELEKLDIKKITVGKGDVYDLDGSRLMCGDSTVEADMRELIGEEKVDMVMTDPPYDLAYLHTKKPGGFGAEQNRRYLETDTFPENFTELWMRNVATMQAKNFSIIVYENWKNIRSIWDEIEKHWKVRNMLVWHLPNRNQGHASKRKFFSKHDIAMVGTSDEQSGLHTEPEEGLFEEAYRTALFAIAGKPQWEGYGSGKRYCPTDFIEHNAATEKSSGQSIIFGVKPVPILIPYIKVLTRRGQLVLEPFGGSGSTLIASITLGRRCFLMEKSPVYAEVILNRWEKFTGKKRLKIYGAQ